MRSTIALLIAFVAFVGLIAGCDDGGAKASEKTMTSDRNATASPQTRGATRPTTLACDPNQPSACGETHWKDKTDAEWRKILTPEQYKIARQAGTERAFTGKYWNEHRKGIYQCAACGQPLFDSSTKFDSGTGWPSFWQPIKADAVATHTDSTLGMERTEVRCSNCGAHLGHVFNDGPKPTGLRYCMNSAVLKLELAKDGK